MATTVNVLTDSEGVRRSLYQGTNWPGSLLRHREPVAPYAINYNNHARVHSAPLNRPAGGPVGPTNPHRPWSASHVAKPVDTYVTRHQPYAVRLREAVAYHQAVTTKANGNLAGYDALNDPHLQDYFLKKFANPHPPVHAGRRSRPVSASSKRSASSRASPRSKVKGETSYTVTVTTGNKKGAGTDAKAYIKINGTKGKLPKQQLKKFSKNGKKLAFKFLKGSTLKFKFPGKDVGELNSVTLETDGLTKDQGWYVEQVEITKKSGKTGKEKTWVFTCQQWFSLHEGDCQISRTLYPKSTSKTEYEVVVVTGDVKGAGTDANVSITLFGKSGQSPKLPLKSTSRENKLFERANSDIFHLKTNSVGPLTKVRIQHDNTGVGPGWYLDRVVVTDLGRPKWKFYFPCGQWLAKDEGDGLICRDLIGSTDPLATRKNNKYKVTVFTADKRGAGTDADVFITLFGEAGDSGEKRLDNSKNNFERGKVDEFVVECPCLGNLQRVRIGHNNKGGSAGWFLDKVIVDDLDQQKVYEFPCHRWLAKDEDDGSIWRDLMCNIGPNDAPPGIPFIIHVMTGDVPLADTSARVYIILFGGKDGEQNSGKIWLENGKFDRGRTDIFNVEVAQALSPLSKIEIGHDNSGPGPGWYLDRVMVNCPSAGYEQWFLCDKWFAVDEGDGLIERTLQETMNMRKKRKKLVTWHVKVYTSDLRGAGTDANVYLVAYGKTKDGEYKKTDEVTLDNKGDNFESGQCDKFKIEMDEIGKPYKIRVGHDNSGSYAGWHLDRIEMVNMATKEEYTFKCNRWMAEDEDDGSIIREIPAEGPNIKKPQPLLKYLLQVYTGNKAGAGTDANVFCNVFGEQGDTGERPLKKSKTSKNKFERGKMDEFEIEAVDLKKLKKIRIGHDGKKGGAGWFLDKVVVMENGQADTAVVFECNRWLDIKEDDGLIVREIAEGGAQMLNTTSYHVHVKTGDKRNAGTDANVFLKIFGKKGDTGSLQLRASESKNKFERARTDIFKLEATDIGDISRIRIGHDGEGAGAGWFLDEVRIDVPSQGKTYIFACHRWLDKMEGDGQTELELEPTTVRQGDIKLPYEVTVWTGDMKGAGTDANVFIQLYGENGKTEEYQLRNRTDNFEQGQVDKFKIEAADIGPILKVRVGHDGTGAFAGWFLEKMLIQRHLTKTSKRKGLKRRRSSIKEIRRGDPGDSESDVERGRKGAHSRGRGRGDSDDEKPRRGSSRRQDSDSEDEKPKRRGSSYPRKSSAKSRDSDSEDEKPKRKSSVYSKKSSLKGKDSDSEDEKPRRKASVYSKKSPLKGKDSDESEDDRPRGRGSVYSKKSSAKGRDSESEDDKPQRRQSVFARKFSKKDESESEEDKKQKARRMSSVSKGRKSRGSDDSEDDSKKTGRKMSQSVSKSRKGRGSDDSEDDSKKSGRKMSQSVSKSRKGRGSDDSEDDSKKSGRKMSQSVSKSRKGRGSDDSEDDSKKSGRKSDQRKSRKYDSDEDSKGKKSKKKNEENEAEIEEYWFVCNRWFAKNEDDGKIVRELLPTDEHGQALDTGLTEVEYKVTVYTGDVFGAGTDANCFINIHGEFGDTGERELKSSNNINKFERNQEDEFLIKAVELGQLKKVKIRHDNKGGGAAWFVGHVEVHDPKDGKTYFFPCQRWLSTNQDDGQISRDLVPVDKSLKKKLDRKNSMAIRNEIALETKAATTTYHVYVHTGDKFGAGTDANVYIILFGDQDDTGQQFLKSSLNHPANKFERNQMDEFVIEAVDIGELKKIKIGHDNAGGGGAWFLDRVDIDCPSLGKKWLFNCGRWLAKDEDDGKLERELFPEEVATEDYVPSEQLACLICIPYEITTYTSDVSGAGTDADVFVVLYGRDTCTQQKSLCPNKKERKKCFERNQMDKFVLELEDVGDTIEKLRIGHDGKGFGTAWHLDRVEIRRLKETGKGSQTFTFRCGRWLAKNEDDGAIVRELVPDKIVEESTRKDGSIKRKEKDVHALENKKYVVDVYTGDVRGGGTDANVFLTIFGDQGDSGERPLAKSETHMNKFERSQVDTFTLEAIDLGQIFKVKVRHDNAMFNPSWFLDKIEVTDTSDNKKYTFHCERWLGKNKDDGKIERSLYVKGYEGDMSSSAGTLRSASGRQFGGSVTSLDSMRSGEPFSKSPRVPMRQLEEIPEGPTIPYTVKIQTGDEKDNGTDAKAWIRIIQNGKKHTGKQYLELTGKRGFQPGSVETFSLEAPEVSDVKQIELGHDGVTPGTGWFVKEVEVDMPTKGKHYFFSCKQWLARDKTDGKTSRTFTHKDGNNSMISYKPMVPYEMTIETGDVDHAGTDAQVFIKVFGVNGASSDIQLDKCSERFERARSDLIKIEFEDIAPLTKLRIGHNGKGNRPEWYLEKVQLRNMDTGDLTTFKAGRWLSKSKEDGKTVVDLVATVKGKAQLKKTTYQVHVKTSDVRGAGTDANVYVILFGEFGDSGELHLKESTTNKKPFENNQDDVFVFENQLSLGHLNKVRVWHDNKGIGAAWHLTHIEVEDATSKAKYMFPCNRWLSKTDDDKLTCRELTCANMPSPSNKDKISYEITVTTSDKKDAGMVHNAWLILEGEQKSSKEFIMENSAKNKVLRRGQTDTFTMVSRNLGPLQRCVLGAVERDDKSLERTDGYEGKWHCHEVVVINKATGDKYTFPCKSWIDIAPKISRKRCKVLELKKVEEGKTTTLRNLATVKYEVVVVTGDVSGAGTDANVFITIYGTNGDTGKRPLTQAMRNLFERNQTDKFTIEAVDLGDLTKVSVEHDNKGWGAGWYLERVEVINTAMNKSWTFPCGQWLDKKRGDGQIYRELLPRD